MRNEPTLPVCYDRQRPAPVLTQTCPQPSGAPLPGKIWDMGSSNSQSVNAWGVAPLFFPEGCSLKVWATGHIASRQPLLFSLSPYYPHDNAEHLETLEKHETPLSATLHLSLHPRPWLQGCTPFPEAFPYSWHPASVPHLPSGCSGTDSILFSPLGT